MSNQIHHLFDQDANKRREAREAFISAFPNSKAAQTFRLFTKAAPQIASEGTKRSYRARQADDFARAFCAKGHAMVDAYLKGMGTKPSKTKIARAVSEDALENLGSKLPRSGIPAAKDSLNTLSNLALTPERLSRLGLTNPLHRI